MAFCKIIRQEKGAAMLEAAIAVPVFFIVVFLGVECMRLAYFSVTLQIIAAQAARAVTIGCNAATTTGMGNKSFAPGLTGCPTSGRGTAAQRAAGFRTFVAQLGQSYGITITQTEGSGENYLVEVNPGSSSAAGNSRDLISVIVRQRIKLLLFNFSYPVTAIAIGRNEPFRN